MVIIAIAAVKGATTAYRRYRRDEARAALISPLYDRDIFDGGDIVSSGEQEWHRICEAQENVKMPSLSADNADCVPSISIEELDMSRMSMPSEVEEEKETNDGEHRSSVLKPPQKAKTKSVPDSRAHAKKPPADYGSYNHARRMKMSPVSNELGARSESVSKAPENSSPGSLPSTAAQESQSVIGADRDPSVDERRHNGSIDSTTSLDAQAARKAWKRATNKASAVAAVSKPRPPLPTRTMNKPPPQSGQVFSLDELANSSNDDAEKTAATQNCKETGSKCNSRDVGSFNHAMRNAAGSLQSSRPKPVVEPSGKSTFSSASSETHQRAFSPGSPPGASALPSASSSAASVTPSNDIRALRKSKTTPIPSASEAVHDPGSFNAALASLKRTRLPPKPTQHAVTRR